MKKPFKFLLLTAVVVCFAFALPKTPDSKRINVLIDAGHGGKDFGAQHDGLTEKQITDKISSKIMKMNIDEDVVLHFTREGDEFIDLENRVKAINMVKPDLVLSLHVNYTKDDERSGMEFFVYDNGITSKSKAYADRLSNKFEHMGYKVADLKAAPFYTLKKSEVPAIHMDLGYLSNEIDREYLTNDKTQDEIAHVVAEFLKEIK